MGLLSSTTLTTTKHSLPYLVNTADPRIDYSRYIFKNQVKKTDTKNQPTKLEFSLVPFDSRFKKLKRGDYISFQTQKFGSWFTGFVITDPELSLVGKVNGAGCYGYTYTAMSDEYLLNLKPLGIVNPFFNMYQGDILKALVDNVCPGIYDTNTIQNGILMPRYQVTPTDKFTDVAKAFCDQAQFTLFGKEGKIYFQPVNDQPFAQVIDGNDMHFTPGQLKLAPTSDPIINDCTVLGDVEPQGLVTEYFAGDGFSGAFNLIYSPFGIDSTVLLTDDFSGTSIDSSLWSLYDDAAVYIQLSSGYVNVLGGEADNTFNVHLDSASPIPVEGQLKLTHGEWDFLAEGLSGANGVLGYICGLWTQDVNANMNGLMYGLQVVNTGGNAAKMIYPVVNGVVDNTQNITVDTVNRYVIRTIVSCSIPFRSTGAGSYTDENGSIVNLDQPLLPATYSFSTLFSRVNINTGVLIDQNTFYNEFSVDSSHPNYALYVPVVSNDLHATFSTITLDYPIQGVLQHFPPVAALSATAPMGIDNGSIFDVISGGTTTLRWPRVSAPIHKILGQNELDALDGMAPDATIADTVTGANTRSSLLGTPQYNVASAALTYFKDSVALVATTPDQGTLISVQYNQAGVATGRVINQTSINAEAASWRDDGVRAIVRTDCDPKPRTSRECQVTAGTIVGDNYFQHYEGTYNCNSDFLTYNYEPISGGIMMFQNLPDVFPLVQAEEVTEVTTTFDSRSPSERFSHDISFGKVDRVQKLLAKYNKPTDVFAPTDSLQMPSTVGLNQAGLLFIGDVLDFEFNGMDRFYYYYVINGQPPVQGGYEVRLSDDGWGSAPSKNLVSRMAYDSNSNSYGFSLPRNSRSKAVFVKQFDGRNSLAWSEDLTQWTTINANVVNTMQINPDDDYSLISKVTPVTGTSQFGISYPMKFAYGEDAYGNPDTGVAATFTVDLKIPKGRTVELSIQGTANNDGSAVYSTHTVTGVGAWQRVSVVANNNTTRLATRSCYIKSYPNLGGRWAGSFLATRASAEENTLVETVYCATNGHPYGALSEHATTVRVNFPAIPPAPAKVSVAVSGNLDEINTVTTGTGATATTTTIQQVDAQGTPTENNPTVTNPQVTVTLPDIQIDVFGVEIRAEDNTTVLYRQNLTAAGYSMAVSLGNSFSNREATYHVYTYNVFGEYSVDTVATATIPPPTVAGVSVDNSTQLLNWNGISAVRYVILISDDAAGTTNPVTFNIANLGGYNTSTYVANSIRLQDSLFTPLKYITVTPFDSVGSGTPIQITHQAPTGTPGTVYRPNAHSDNITTHADAYGVTYVMENGYDTDNTTSGILQATSGTSGLSATALSTTSYSGFSAVGTTAGMTLYALISVTTDGGTASVTASDGTNSYSLFNTTSAGWAPGTEFTVSAVLPTSTLMSDVTVLVTAHAIPIREQNTDQPEPAPGQPPAQPSYYYDSTSSSIEVYDVYIQ